MRRLDFLWKTGYAKQVITVLATKLCIVRPMKYSEVLELDRIVRDYPELPVEHLEKLKHGGGSPGVFQALMATLHKDIC